MAVPMAANRQGRNMAESRGPLFRNLDDDLVGADETEFAAHHSLRKIGVGAARIEQLRAMRETRLLLLEMGELDRTLLLEPAIITPRQNAVRSHDRIAQKIGDDQHGQRWERCPLDEFDRLSGARYHALTESGKRPGIKLFSMRRCSGRHNSPPLPIPLRFE